MSRWRALQSRVASVVAIRYSQRDEHEKGVEHQAPGERDSNMVQVASMLVPLAQARIDAQSQDWDSHDTKSVGLVAGLIAAMGLLIAVRDSLQGWWWAPAIGLITSTILFYLGIRGRKFNLGPDLEAFYRDFGISPPLEAQRQMLSQLFFAIHENEHVIPIKRQWYMRGEQVLVVTIIVSFLLLLALHTP